MMKKTIMSLAVVSALFSGGAMAAFNSNGQADQSASNATLNFTGKVTSSLCQVSTDDISKTISLGEISASQLKNGTGRAPSHTFTVDLVNCDTTLNSVSYVIQDGNGAPSQGQATSAYLIPKSGDTSARGVGVFITDATGSAIQIGQTQNHGVIKDSSGSALGNQTISLAAYIGTANAQAGTTNGSTLTAGTVDATGVMTIRTAAAPTEGV
ncbi:TPA: fimbrial protein [Enterobacter hormaechei]